MTALNHLAVGAIIGTAIGDPWLAVPVAFLSHFLLDALPHFGYSLPPERLKERDKKPLFWGVLAADVLLSITLVAWLRLYAGNLAFVTALVAYTPDIAWLYRYAKERKTGKWESGSWLSRFHSRIQWCERPWGLTVEVVMAIACILILGKTI